MDYYSELNKTLSLRLLEPIVQSAAQNTDEFEILFELISSENSKVAWRAAWACEKITKLKPNYFLPNHVDIIVQTAISTDNNGLLRTCLVILNSLSKPDTIDVDLMNACYTWLVIETSPIAVKAIALKILYRFCLIEPDLKSELLANIEYLDTISLSPAMQSSKRNILKKLKNK
jgi:hypothetical protein